MKNSLPTKRTGFNSKINLFVISKLSGILWLLLITVEMSFGQGGGNLTISKSGPVQAIPGDYISYNISVGNGTGADETVAQYIYNLPQILP